VSAPRFASGDRVRVRDAHPPGHIRTPFFLRGKAGEVVLCHGAFANPERLAYGEDGLPKVPLYQVRFDLRPLWAGDTDAGPRDTLEADIYEHWLEGLDP
jgi:nitrile hydratase